MTRHIEKHRLALRDLAEHAEYIRQDSPRSALRFLKAAEKAFADLARMPAMGGLEDCSKPELAGLRCWPIRGFKNYLVFYLPLDNGIQVVRILHGSRDIKAILNR